MCASMCHISRMSTMVKTRPDGLKRQRLVARVSAEDKDLITRAAALSGQSVGSFVLVQARKAALDAIEERERIVLNAEQSRRFAEAVLALPAQPTAAMAEALKRYGRDVRSDLD